MASYAQSPQDEGYSEDPMNAGVMSSGAEPSNLSAWLESIPSSQRAELAMSILNNLPTSEVCEIVRRLRPRLYIDFFQYLPQEVCLKILGFLDPLSLINTARASHKWMQLALDRHLWEHLYFLEGFRVVRSEVKKFEDSLNIERSRSGEADVYEQPNKRRATPQRVAPALHSSGDSGDLEMADADGPMINQESLFGPSRERQPEMDENMTDLQPASSHQDPLSPSYPTRAGRLSVENIINDRRLSTAPSISKPPLPMSSMFSLISMDPDGKRKLNWQYLYSQRRRLEANWEAERYTNFQLPHPSHPEEAHKECIYTIQFFGKYLVSGSRDKTLRVWDLDTRRLIRKLERHTGSVLCLQFDADPEEDLIVSGSSDSTVILWRFSTGQILQILRRAHRESVLNVRFDKRVLVTCSKDKTIKIFNRKPMNPGEVGYNLSHLPGPVHPVPKYLNNFGFNPSPTAGLPTIPQYSMISCLEGHNAAVNAVQIHGSEVVSASGDRTVKLWNWPEQKCERTFIGHTKGIACVQYDGRRVVSGSSDNEVKIFDKETSLEVASLRAHTNLVRTVQAGFGDLPYSQYEDTESAKIIDNEYFKAVDAGIVDRNALSQRGRPRNAGSRRPEDITAYGAKLPPGGGGGRYGRIVSGSYDETIIIWRRDKEGIWKPLHTLRQEDAAQVASRARRSHAQLLHTAQPTSHANPATTSIATGPTAPFAPGSDQWYYHLIDMAVSGGTATLRNALLMHPRILRHQQRLRQAIHALPVESRQALVNEVVAAANAQPQLNAATSGSTSSSVAAPWGGEQGNQSGEASSSVQTRSPAAAQAAPLTQVNQGSLGQGSSQAAASTSVQQPPTANVTMAAPTPAPAAPHHHQPVHQPPPNMARVFKLQFDARRVICCSQAPVILGWDFANRDEQLMEASRFFGPVE
ncbi:WD40-repeat-containing domain protein [Bisporella sp. PMI_857]|nr:WD40-repeat-containing domain protein [Bisporella sp. PMI_857]